MKRALLLVNASARKGQIGLDEAERSLSSLGYSVIKAGDVSPEHYCRLIYSYKDTVDLVVLGGGDGTVRCALKALVETKLPFALIPLGTANNLARSLGIGPDIESSLQVLREGEKRKIDVGVVNGQYFVNVAGLGLSTVINQRVPGRLKRRFGVLAYAWYFLKIIRRFKPFHARIRTQYFDRYVWAMQISVCNGRYYGTGLTAVEDASISDGRLDLISAEIRKWWHGFKLIPAFISGKYQGKRDVRLVQGRSIEVWTRLPLRIDTDGEITTRTPAVFHLLKGAIEVIAPAEIKKLEPAEVFGSALQEADGS